jgi:FRG domain
MYSLVSEFYTDSLDELIRLVLQVQKTNEYNPLYFRGESKDHGISALTPSIYRNDNLVDEHKFYREMQRFNDHEFFADKTAFDKLARMQHYQCPTRMIDISEDVLSATYFALNKREKNTDSILYVLEIMDDKIKYYDSDAVSVVANLAKAPLDNPNNNEKSKRAVCRDGLSHLNDRAKYCKTDLESKSYLLHDIKEEKPYFEDKIDPKHLFSLFCVKPKYSNQRIHGQKGAFLLYGLNKIDAALSIPVFQQSGSSLQLALEPGFHPIANVTKIKLSPQIQKSHLEKLGISEPYIYPELDKVSEYLTNKGK